MMMRPLLLFPLATCLAFQQPTKTFTRIIRCAAAKKEELRRSSVEMEDLPSMEPFKTDLDTSEVVNSSLADNNDDDMTNASNSTDLPVAAALTFDKFLTMQDKRVVVTIRYSDGCGLKPYYLTVAKKLKASHPDVVIEKRILASVVVGAGDMIFEILVDGKVVLGTSRKQRGMDAADGKSVFVSMQQLDLAISKARRKRRPSTLYGEDPSTTANGIRLDMLRKVRHDEKKPRDKWDDD